MTMHRPAVLKLLVSLIERSLNRKILFRFYSAGRSNARRNTSDSKFSERRDIEAYSAPFDATMLSLFQFRNITATGYTNSWQFRRPHQQAGARASLNVITKQLYTLQAAALHIISRGCRTGSKLVRLVCKITRTNLISLTRLYISKQSSYTLIAEVYL